MPKYPDYDLSTAWTLYPKHRKKLRKSYLLAFLRNEEGGNLKEKLEVWHLQNRYDRYSWLHIVIHHTQNDAVDFRYHDHYIDYLRELGILRKSKLISSPFTRNNI